MNAFVILLALPQALPAQAPPPPQAPAVQRPRFWWRAALKAPPQAPPIVQPTTIPAGMFTSPFPPPAWSPRLIPVGRGSSVAPGRPFGGPAANC